MDQTDIALCRLLLANCRTPVRELGDKLGLSVAAVHARIQALRDAGIIKTFTARISLLTLQGSIALTWGVSRLPSNDDILTRLRADNHIYWITFGGAGYVYVGAYLRSAAEMDACVSFIAKEAEIDHPVVGLLSLGTGLPEAPVLSRLDCRILRSLHRDARKSVADVAKEIGLSAKTVGRHLARMTHDSSAELSMDWYPDATNDIICLWHLDLAPGADRDQALALLANRYGGNLLFTMPMGNMPRFILGATWTGSMKDLKELHTRLRQEKAFERALPNVIYTGYVYDTWRDELLMKWAGPKEGAA